MIRLIQDAVTLEEAVDIVKKVLDTEPWRRDNCSLTNITTAIATPRNPERCWAVEVSNQMRCMHLFVSKENSDEEPFAEVHDGDTDSYQRRHVCPVTGKWVENYNLSRRMLGDVEVE